MVMECSSGKCGGGKVMWFWEVWRWYMNVVVGGVGVSTKHIVFKGCGSVMSLSL